MPPPSGRDGSGACSGATERFFAWGPPWRETPGKHPGKNDLRPVRANRGRGGSRKHPAFSSENPWAKSFYLLDFRPLRGRKWVFSGLKIGPCPAGPNSARRMAGIGVQGQQEFLQRGGRQVDMQAVDLLGLVFILAGKFDFGAHGVRGGGITVPAGKMQFLGEDIGGDLRAPTGSRVTTQAWLDLPASTPISPAGSR